MTAQEIQSKTDLPQHVIEQLDRAEWLALQARSAALSGDHEKASKLRKEMMNLYDRLEASLPQVTQDGQ